MEEPEDRLTQRILPMAPQEDDLNGTYYCPNCCQAIQWVLPVEPVYDVAVAAWLIPTTLYRLKKHLWEHRDKYPKLYRKAKNRTLRRVLRARDIRRLRRYFIKQKDNNGFYIDLADYGAFKKKRDKAHQRTSPITFQIAEGDIDAIDGVTIVDPAQ